jgi:hypothetical protein
MTLLIGGASLAVMAGVFLVTMDLTNLEIDRTLPHAMQGTVALIMTGALVFAITATAPATSSSVCSICRRTARRCLSRPSKPG